MGDGGVGREGDIIMESEGAKGGAEVVGGGGEEAAEVGCRGGYRSGGICGVWMGHRISSLGSGLGWEMPVGLTFYGGIWTGLWQIESI